MLEPWPGDQGGGVPFLTGGPPTDALRHSMLLLGVNLIYVLRAWTEERHLRRDPACVQYADWIDQHGLVAYGRRLLLRQS